jgi:hypothetical protein
MGKLITNLGHSNKSWDTKSYEIFYFSIIKLNFLIIFEELLNGVMWLKLPTG